ncbi:MAG: hypothetical protein KDA75_12300 [Planctomycetaceae bacterium]|nr:hypothetical protein [Planctomycetaceae bacterium]
MPPAIPVTQAWSKQGKPLLYYTYERDSIAFRQLAKALFTYTRRDLSSAQGRYGADVDHPFVINAMDDDPRLTSLDELPKGLPSLRFQDKHRVFDAAVNELGVSFGTQSVRGPELRTLRPLPTSVRRLVSVPDHDRHFGLTGEAIVEVDLGAQTAEVIPVPRDLHKFSQPLDLCVDAERNRLVILTSGNGGFLFGFNPDREDWSMIAARPAGIHSLAHSMHDDLYYGLASAHSEAGEVARLVQFNAAGAIVGRIPLASPFYPGCLSGGQTRLVAFDRYLAVIADPGGYSEEIYVRDAAIYVIDLETHDVWLTRKVPLVRDAGVRGGDPETAR